MLVYLYKVTQPLNIIQNPLLFMSSDKSVIKSEDLPLRDKEDEEDEYLFDSSLTLDEQYMYNLRSCMPIKTMRMLTPEKIITILEHLKDGLSLSTAGSAVGVIPSTLGKYLAEGKKDYEAMTEKDFEGHERPEDAFTDKAKFFIDVSRARGTCIARLHNVLLDRAEENGKEWISQYLLQIMEPEIYSQKYRIEKLKLDARDNDGGGAVGKIEFSFINGMGSRPKDERTYLVDELAKLELQYGNPKTSVDAIPADFVIKGSVEEKWNDEEEGQEF